MKRAYIITSGGCVREEHETIIGISDTPKEAVSLARSKDAEAYASENLCAIRVEEYPLNQLLFPLRWQLPQKGQLYVKKVFTRNPVTLSWPREIGKRRKDIASWSETWHDEEFRKQAEGDIA